MTDLQWFLKSPARRRTDRVHSMAVVSWSIVSAIMILKGTEERICCGTEGQNVRSTILKVRDEDVHTFLRMGSR